MPERGVCCVQCEDPDHALLRLPVLDGLRETQCCGPTGRGPCLHGGWRVLCVRLKIGGVPGTAPSSPFIVQDRIHRRNAVQTRQISSASIHNRRWAILKQEYQSPWRLCPGFVAQDPYQLATDPVYCNATNRVPIRFRAPALLLLHDVPEQGCCARVTPHGRNPTGSKGKHFFVYFKFTNESRKHKMSRRKCRYSAQGVKGLRARPPPMANKAFTGRTLSKEWPENNPWWHNLNTGFQHMKAHWVNIFLHTLCMGVSDADWEGCHDCYFHADLPSSSETYLEDFLKCAKEYKLSEHFKPCQELAEAKDLQIEIDNTLITLSPMDKNSRGRMVVRCLKVTATGTAAISCIKRIIEVQETTMEKLDLYDFFLLGQCFSLENEMSMDKTLIPNLAVPNRYGEYVDYGVKFYNTLYYKATPEQEALKKIDTRGPSHREGILSSAASAAVKMEGNVELQMESDTSNEQNTNYDDLVPMDTIEKPNKKLIRVLSVLGYVISVTMAGVMLSLYYVFLWKPSINCVSSQPLVSQFTVAHPLVIKRQLVQPPARAVLGPTNPQPTNLWFGHPIVGAPKQLSDKNHADFFQNSIFDLPESIHGWNCHGHRDLDGWMLLSDQSNQTDIYHCFQLSKQEVLPRRLPSYLWPIWHSGMDHTL
ncbi:unnamed protein product [Notodromas monacha]|uniref:Uncharacterized protein n=1 Tax=Notodromas monacha TaxID=399045 RepID=A0A7R9GFF8_9CRUS|nr:unnamed protein product [Notodromas monacha]CAG0920668.1 unnamed protein product [Notodromas monacha]